ncbi:MAG TPA: hypothetical protein VF765_01190 [Polyangiaceae bacterium]
MDGPSDVDLAELRTCRELRGAHVARVIGSRQATLDLLRHLARISAPGTGAAKVLLVFAWMGTSACGWLEGALRVELEAEQDGTRIDVKTDLGGGTLERILPAFVIKARIEEFWTALRGAPRILGSLQMHELSDRQVVLSASAEARKTSEAPPSVQIAPDSLYAHAPAPPRVPDAVETEDVEGAPDSGWDD